jgi:hypothetical protein
LVRSALPGGTFEVSGNGVRVENISTRAIKRLMLLFTWKSTFRSSVQVALDALAVGETRDYLGHDIKLILPSDAVEMTLSVIPTGAAFEDGSHWAAPRTLSRPLEVLCLGSRSPITLRECELDDRSYRITFDVADQRIVAYRLGIIEDTPDRFTVKLGKWVDLAEAKQNRGGGFLDSGQSVGDDHIFHKDAGEKDSGDGKAVTVPVSTAVFVAALRFADGHVWSQDTRRQELLWDW